jgi:dihydroorotate dehydrogenase (NAD+) catalytic subunit
VLVNVVGFREEEYAAVIARLDDAGVIAAYELNLSCPNIAAGGLEFGADRASVVNIIARCRQATSRPLFAKLSPALPDIGGMAVVARDAGADGISVVNTIPGFAYRRGDRVGGVGEAALGQGHGGVSGPALLPIGILAVRRVLERTAGIPVIVVGGITDPEDARQYLKAGASLVAIGTAALADPRLPLRVIEQLGWD